MSSHLSAQLAELKTKAELHMGLCEVWLEQDVLLALIRVSESAHSDLMGYNLAKCSWCGGHDGQHFTDRSDTCEALVALSSAMKDDMPLSHTPTRVDNLLPMTLTWRMESTCRDDAEPEDGVVCILSNYDVCVGRFAVPLAAAMVQRLNL